MIRWEAGPATPTNGQLHELASAVFAKDESLAGEIAAETGETLQSLGIAPLAAPPAPAAAPAPPAKKPADGPGPDARKPAKPARART